MKTLRDSFPSAQPGGVDSAAVLSLLTETQRSFVVDPARYKVGRATRRAGKTHMIAAYMIYECLKAPRIPVLYAGLTRDSAKEAVWPILVDMIDRLGIEAKFNESALHVNFRNGSKITVFGCDMENARNRLRGRKFKLACFDETGFYSKLDAIVYAVLPMLADYRGTLCLTSSPGELLQGLFYEADQGKTKQNWSRYFWSIHANPHFQRPSEDPRYRTLAEEELDTVLQLQFNGDATHPGYRREWLGDWVSDHTSLVYPLSEANLIAKSATLPREQYGLGAAFSPFVSALVVGKYSEYSREFQIVDSKEYDNASLDEFSRVVDSAIAFYKPEILVGYTEDYSKDIANELRRRYQLPIHFIDTRDKAFHQRIFANDLMAGHIKIKETLPLVERYGKIVRDSLTGEQVAGQADYAPNAALALYRKVYQTTLSSFTPALSEDERHIQQLEQSRYIDEPQWFDRYD